MRQSLTPRYLPPDSEGLEMNRKGMSKIRKRLGFPAYLVLALILVILALWNYVFNKLFDQLYGNFNTLGALYLLGWVLLFAFGFGVSLSLVC